MGRVISSLVCVVAASVVSQAPQVNEPIAAEPRVEAQVGHSTNGSVPIKYYGAHAEDRLHPADLEKLIDRLRASPLAGHKVWFVWVDASPSVQVAPGYPFRLYVVVYARPLVTTGKVRRGSALSAQLCGTSWADYTIFLGEAFEYAQIMSSEGDADDASIPSDRSEPFRLSSPASDEDLLKLDRCARDGARAGGLPHIADEAPISFALDDPDTVKAYLGVHGGIVVTCRRAEGNYRPSGEVVYFVAP